jgi:cytochrome oxidase assembly protein ShyY1
VRRTGWGFLLTPRWLGFALLACLAAVTMVGLGRWQLDRYHQRDEINARIDAAAVADPVPLTNVLTSPRTGGAGESRVGPPPPKSAEWTRVSATGRYDPRHEILARGRTVNGAVGFEVFTPLVLADGAAVLVDRGWVAAPLTGGASARPEVPPAPAGEVTVVGRVHAPESRASVPTLVSGTLEVRRLAPAQAAAVVPYPLFGAYVTMEEQTPPAVGFTPIPPRHENALINASYVVQWWLLAGLTLFGFGYAAWRERRSQAEIEREVGDLLAPDHLADAPVSPAV